MGKFEFAPKQWVLVRDDKQQKWSLARYSHYDTDYEQPHRMLLNVGYEYCIPYNDETAHLLGTTDDYVEPWIPKDGDFCVAEVEGSKWIIVFKKYEMCGGKKIIRDYLSYSYESGSLYLFASTTVVEELTSSIRPAAEEEKQLLLSKLAEIGKKWDADKKCIEDVWTPKEGDFIACNKNFLIAICKSCTLREDGSWKISAYARYDRYSEELEYETTYTTATLREATEDEKKLFLYEFHKVNTDWDSEKKEFVPYKWHPEEGMPYWIVSPSGVPQLISCYVRRIFNDETTIGNCFPTIDAARPYAAKFREIFKD